MQPDVKFSRSFLNFALVIAVTLTSLQWLQTTARGQASTPKSSVQQVNEIHDQLYEGVRWNQVASEYRRKAQREPTNPVWLGVLADIDEFNFDWQDAELLMRKAVKLEPQEPTWHFRLGIYLDNQGKTKAAQAALETAFRFVNRDHSFQYHNYLGKLFALSQRWEEAEAAYRIALPYRPHSASLMSRLGTSLMRQNRLEESLFFAQQAAALRAKNPRFHDNLGWIFLKLNKFDEAEISFRTALQLNPKVGQFHNDLGIALGEQGNFSAAEQSFRNAIQAKSKNYEYHLHLGQVLGEQKKFRQAQISLRRALQLEPQCADCHTVQGYLFVQQKMEKAALAEFLLAYKLDPKDEIAAHNLRISLALKQSKHKPTNWSSAPGDQNRMVRSLDKPKSFIRSTN